MSPSRRLGLAVGALLVLAAMGYAQRPIQTRETNEAQSRAFFDDLGRVQRDEDISGVGHDPFVATAAAEFDTILIDLKVELTRTPLTRTATPTPPRIMPVRATPTEPFARALTQLARSGVDHSCDPNYDEACIPRVGYDLDCDEVDDRSFIVTGDDPHGFDGDSDGVGCESY